MNYINALAYTFAFLLLVLVYRTFRKVSLSTLFKNAKTRSQIRKKREEAEANGEKPFTFERGNVVIYAKTQSRAIYDYQEFKKQQKKDLKAKLQTKKA